MAEEEANVVVIVVAGDAVVDSIVTNGVVDLEVVKVLAAGLEFTSCVVSVGDTI